MYSFSHLILAFFLMISLSFLSSCTPFPRLLFILYGPSHTGSIFPPFLSFCAVFSSHTFVPTDSSLYKCFRSYVSFCAFCALSMFSFALWKADCLDLSSEATVSSILSDEQSSSGADGCVTSTSIGSHMCC